MQKSFVLATLVISLWLSAGGGARAAENRSRPNILFIMTDDHAAHALSCYGSKVNQTPNLDRLAKGGMLFRNAFVPNSICTPSRASILSGQYSHINGVPVFNRFDGERQNVAKRLQASGYSTAMIGKWHLGSDPTGFDHWIVLPGQGVYNNPEFLTPGGRLKINGYVTDVITDLGVEYLERRPKDKPFFLMLHHKAPHRAWTPDPKNRELFKNRTIPEPPTLFDDYATRPAALPENQQTIARDLTRFDLKLEPPAGLTPAERQKWQSVKPMVVEITRPGGEKEILTGNALVKWKYQRYMQDYLACVQSVDDNTGRLLDYLDKTGLATNTVVIYTSDNGFYLGDLGMYDKRFMYEPGLRVPLLVRWPGVTKPGSASELFALNVDFAPTFLALAGVAAPGDMQGRSLADLLRGGSPADWRDALYYRYYHDPGDHNTRAHLGMRTATHKLIHFWKQDAWEMYDLVADPLEQRNLAGDPAQKQQFEALKARLARLKTEMKDDDRFATELPQGGVDGNFPDHGRLGLRSVSDAVTHANTLESIEVPAGAILRTNVFISGENGYHTYRIPSLAATARGTLLAFAEGRKAGAGDAGNVDIVIRRSSDRGQSWSEMKTIWDDGAHTCGNPCVVEDRTTGVLWLLLTWNHAEDNESKIIAQQSKDTRRVFVSSSADDGVTWTSPREITSDVKPANWTWYATGPGDGIQMENGPHKGRLVIPCDHIEASTKRYYSHIVYSDDHGQTWKLGGSSPQDKVNECAVAELAGGKLLLNMRNYDPAQKTRQQAVSLDGGLTWGEQRHATQLVEPVCQAAMRRASWPSADRAGVVLFANPSSLKRERMSIHASFDDGATWPKSRLIDARPSAYSCMAVLADSTVGILYESGKKSPYETIVFARYNAAGLDFPAFGEDRANLRFDGPLSRDVLESYLSRSVTMMDLCTGQGDVADNIRMLSSMGARFAGRTLYLWGGEQNLSDRIARAKAIAPKCHAAMPDLILQGCVFEIVTRQVDSVPVPARVFEEFGLPVENRHFRYDQMLFDKGVFHNHWGRESSVPDISKLETKLWFYHVATAYLDAGMEAIHFGQVALIGRNDPERRHWWDVLSRVRKYAAAHARRHWVLCDAHTPDGGPVVDGKLLFDFHSFPLRIKEVAGKPQQGVLEKGYLDSIFGRSKGGMSPSGWKCDSLPYLVELDNWGSSQKAGQAGLSYWTWGYDEIDWFARQPEAYRNEWLRYAWKWVRDTDPNGYLQMPGSRCLHDPTENKQSWYYANMKSHFADGFGQEETIREIWAGK